MIAGDGVRAFAAVLLAGGQSRRMGRDKALLPLPDGRLLWERQLGVLRALNPAELFISGFARPGFPAHAPLLPDEFPGSGPLGGIAAALAAMASPHLVVLALDLPSLDAPFLKELLANSAEGSGTIPKHPGADGFYEPLAAVYPKTCAPSAREAMRAGCLSLQSYVRDAGPLLRPYLLTAGQEPLFANWNRPEDVSG